MSFRLSIVVVLYQKKKLVKELHFEEAATLQFKQPGTLAAAL